MSINSSNDIKNTEFNAWDSKGFADAIVDHVATHSPQAVTRYSSKKIIDMKPAKRKSQMVKKADTSTLNDFKKFLK